MSNPPISTSTENLKANLVAGVDRNEFQRRARLLQSLWRHDRGLEAGTHRSKPLGSRLTEADAAAGRNFLTPGIHALVEAELLVNGHRAGPDRKLLEPRRLRGDLLSSQPMCFNLFGELALDLSLATRVCRALWPDRVDRVLDVRFEWSPGRMDDRYLENKSAADVFIDVARPDGERSFIAIETKYHEDMKGTAGKWKPRYDELLATQPIVDLDEQVKDGRLQQVLLDHLLVVALEEAGDGWHDGLFVLLYPEPNAECATVADTYADRCSDVGAKSFQALTLEAVVDAMASASRARWIGDFRRRYLDWDRVPAA